MYIMTKKVIIVSIVIFITFSSIILSQREKLNLQQLDIAIVSPESKGYETSYMNTLTTDLNQIILDYNSENINNLDPDAFTSASSSVYQVNKENEIKMQLQTIINDNEMIILFSDVYNKYLENFIVKNPQKKFVLVYNSSEFEYPNVDYININLDEILNEYKDDILNLTNTKKIIYIDSIANIGNSNAQKEIFDSIFADELEIEYIILSDIDNNTELINELSNLYEDGYDLIISFSKYNQKAVIDSVNSYNEQINLELNSISVENEESSLTNQTSEDTISEDNDEINNQEESNLNLVYAIVFGEVQETTEIESENYIIFEEDYYDILDTILNDYINNKMSYHEYQINNFELSNKVNI